MPSHFHPSALSDKVAPRRGPQITDFTVDTPDSKARASLIEPGPSRWRTKEFMLYGLIFAAVVPVMIYWPMRLSSRESIWYA